MIGDRLRSKMIIFGHPACIDTAKCMQVAAEKGLDIEARTLNLDNLDGEADFLEVSPLKIAPALRHVDYMISGVLSTMSYIDDKGFGLSLVPRNAVVRAVMYQWIEVALQNQGKIISGDMQSLAPALDALDKQLTSNRKGDYICGEFSLADIHWSACMNMCEIKEHGDQINSRSNLKTWFDRVKEHPSTSKEKITPFSVVPTAEDIQNNTLKGVSINV